MDTVIATLEDARFTNSNAYEGGSIYVIGENTITFTDLTVSNSTAY